MSEIRYKKVKYEDREVFLELSGQFYSTDAVIAPLPMSYHERIFEEVIRSEEYLAAYLFLFDGRNAGYGLISKRFATEAGGMECWFEDLYVLPAYRNKGIAGGFLEYIKKCCTVNRYRLEVEEDNERAVELYRRHGFEFLPYGQMICDRK